MYSSSNYPPGCYDNMPGAPWNEPPEPEDKEVNVCASITLSKSLSIAVNDYTEEHWEDWDRGDEGEVIHTGGISYDYSDCDLIKAYKEQEFTIPELLERLKEYATKELLQWSSKSSKAKELRRIISACEEWTVDDEEVILN